MWRSRDRQTSPFALHCSSLLGKHGNCKSGPSCVDCHTPGYTKRPERTQWIKFMLARTSRKEDDTSLTVAGFPVAAGKAYNLRKAWQLQPTTNPQEHRVACY